MNADPDYKLRKGDSDKDHDSLLALRAMSIEGERLARLETKVDLILEHQEAFRRSFEKHDDRLKHLENTKSTIYGIAAAIGALSAFLMDGLRAAILNR